MEDEARHAKTSARFRQRDFRAGGRNCLPAGVPFPVVVRIVGIAGSLREGSYTHKAVAIALAGAEEVGAETEMIDLAALDLPFCDGRDDESTYPPGVFTLREKVKRAQGVIIGTPEYHGSYSGVVKNALDLMGFEEFEGKMVGLISISGGCMGGTSALNALRSVGRVLHAWVIPEQASIPQAERAFDAEGRFVDPRLDARVREVGKLTARFAHLHSAKEAQEFIRLWEQAPRNPGGEDR